MARYATNCMRYLDMRKIKYLEIDDYTLRISYSCDNIDNISVYVRFDKDGGNTVTLNAFQIANFGANSEKNLKGLIVCNALNQKLRWVKFYLDEESDLIAECDAIVDPETVGEECLSLILKIVHIVDESYPLIMKALWG